MLTAQPGRIRSDLVLLALECKSLTGDSNVAKPFPPTVDYPLDGIVGHKPLPLRNLRHKVAAALVGTFLGILLCYGFLGPMAANIKKQTNAESEYFLCLRMGLLAFMKGVPPILALEAARRAIPHHVRPTFQEMDKACRKPAGAPASEAAA